MFERFSDRARKVMALANEEAQRLNHEYIDSAHILLGIAREGSGVACTVLKNLGIGSGDIRLKLEQRIKAGPDKMLTGKLPQALDGKKVIEYAIEEARSLDHNYVGTEHLLLGMLHRYKEHGKHKETTGGKILRTLGLTLKKARPEVLSLLGAGAEETVSTPSIAALFKKKIKTTPKKKKERPVKCKPFEVKEEISPGAELVGDEFSSAMIGIEKFLRGKEFAGAAQSSVVVGNIIITKITIFYREKGS